MSDFFVDVFSYTNGLFELRGRDEAKFLSDFFDDVFSYINGPFELRRNREE